MILVTLAILATLPTFNELAANTTPEVERERDSVVFIAPEGIHIPSDHHGLVFMNDVPDVAIEVFDSDAQVMLGTLAEISQTHELLDVTVAPSGGLRGLTLHVDGFPQMPDENLIKYLLLLPDGSVEFATANADEPGCRLILQTDPITGGISVRCRVTDCTGICELIGTVQPDGGLKLTSGCADRSPEKE